MTFQQIVLWVIAAGTLIGVADRITGNHLKLGSEFDNGFHTMGPLALGMVGILCLAPVIASWVRPVLTPLCMAVGADPALAGAILANDMGGYSLAAELAQDPQAGRYIGVIVASMLGCTLVFSIPVGLGIIAKEDQRYFSQGLLIGFITIPPGCLAGGLAAGFDVRMVVANTLPVLVLALLPALGLKFFPGGMIRACTISGKLITAASYIGLAAAVFEYLTGAALIPSMAPVTEGLSTVAGIAVVLPGTFVMLMLLRRLLAGPLDRFGQKIGLDPAASAGLMMTLANSVPVFHMMKDMKKRGIVVNTAWLVSATAALGDHLGFTAGVQPQLILPMIIGKLTGGILAVLIAILTTKDPDSGTVSK